MEPIEMNPIQLNLPSNSKNSKAQPPQQAPTKPKYNVVVKTPFYRKVTNALFPEDPTSVRSFIVRDIIVPSLKNTLYTVFTDGLAMYMFGSTKAGARRPSGTEVSTSRTRYGAYFGGGNNDRQASAVDYNKMNYRDFYFNSSADAHAALDELTERLKYYITEYDGRPVTVADWYDILEKTPPRTAEYWGWYDLSDAMVIPDHGRWYVELPRHKDISRDDRRTR